MFIWRPAPARGSRQRVGRLRPGERPKRRSGGHPPDTERTPPISCDRGPRAGKLATKLALVPWCSRARLWEKSMQLGGERRKKGKGRADEVFFCLVAVCQVPRHWLPVQPHHLLRDMKTIIWISFGFFFSAAGCVFKFDPQRQRERIVLVHTNNYISSSFRTGKPKQKSDKPTYSLEDFFFFFPLSVFKARDEGILQAGMRPLGTSRNWLQSATCYSLGNWEMKGMYQSQLKVRWRLFFLVLYIHTWVSASCRQGQKYCSIRWGLPVSL